MIDVVVDEHKLTCHVTGSVDSLIKTAARHTVHKIQSGQPGLEEVFLKFYDNPEVSETLEPKEVSDAE